MSKIDPEDRCGLGIRALSFHPAVALVSLLIQSNTPFINNIMASNNAPAWLQANTTEAPIVTPLETEIAVPSPPSKNNNGSGATTSSAAEEAELPSIILFMRLANMGVAIAMITISVGS
jgi:hypothetical protein